MWEKITHKHTFKEKEKERERDRQAKSPTLVHNPNEFISPLANNNSRTNMKIIFYYLWHSNAFNVRLRTLIFVDV